MDECVKFWTALMWMLVFFGWRSGDGLSVEKMFFEIHDVIFNFRICILFWNEKTFLFNEWILLLNWMLCWRLFVLWSTCFEVVRSICFELVLKDHVCQLVNSWDTNVSCIATTNEQSSQLELKQTSEQSKHIELQQQRLQCNKRTIGWSRLFGSRLFYRSFQ